MSTSPRVPSEPHGIDSDAMDWLVRRHGGGFDARDEAALQAWLAADAEHPRAYARQQAEWTALERLPADGIALLRANLRSDLAAEAKAASRSRAARPEQPARRRFWVPAFSAAAVAVVAGAGGLMAWQQWQAQPVFAQSFGTPRGQQLDVRLPDDSQMRLDTATRVAVTYYRQRREVRLSEGQVVFHVHGDSARPFDVLAGPLRITVVGTRFSVRHTPGLPGDEGVRVAMEEGRVRVQRVDAATPDGGAFYLGAGQQSGSDAAGVPVPVAPVSTAGIAPWRDNRVSFDNTRLDQVLAELARYGDTGLVVRDPAVAALRVTGTFNPIRPDSFATVLPQAAPVRLRAIGGGREIVPAK
ncbi:FecR family protein [Variovorax sp. 54]|uniref:FecR family protein n=1 Tax=Variovorax sp. 54 TaxID=2035212 RepID=UPI000C17E0C6|nr:FecR domain-containing protein [Variovorax sp. 54]PIF77715.1 FecR family protein [Variovorax sp. 54]